MRLKYFDVSRARWQFGCEYIPSKLDTKAKSTHAHYKKLGHGTDPSDIDR